jgi:hypothetical protein
VLTLLEKLASGFWNLIRRIVGLILPFFTEARELKALGRGLRWGLHILLLAGILAGLWWANRALNIPRLVKERTLQDVFLPLIFLLIYVLLWLGWWLWKLLTPEAEEADFPDIEEAWDEAVAALNAARIDLTEAPLFLVLGRPMGGEEALFTAAQLQLNVKGVPDRGDPPVRVWANRDGIYVTCAGASLLGRQCAILAGEVAAGPQQFGTVEGADDAFKTMQPQGLQKGIQAVLVRAREQGRDHTQLSDTEKEEIRRLLAEEASEAAQKARGPRPNLLKNGPEVDELSARLRCLCRLIVRDRKPYCPVNGVLLLVPFAGTDSDDDANQTGALCQLDLANARQALHVNCPRFALVCDLETSPGFREFVERFPGDQRQRRLGQRLPLAPDLNDAETVAGLAERGAQWVCSTVFPSYVYKLFRLEAPGRDELAAVVKGNARLYQLLYQMRERRNRLGRLLARAVGGEQPGPALFGGCYLAATGKDAGREQAFIAGVFRRLTENQNFVSWTDEALQHEAAYERWTRYGYAGISVCVVLVAGLAFYVFFVQKGPL